MVIAGEQWLWQESSGCGMRAVIVAEDFGRVQWLW